MLSHILEITQIYKIVVTLFILHYGISCTGKLTFLYLIKIYQGLGFVPRTAAGFNIKALSLIIACIKFQSVWNFSVTNITLPPAAGVAQPHMAQRNLVHLNGLIILGKIQCETLGSIWRKCVRQDQGVRKIFWFSEHKTEIILVLRIYGW